MIPHHHGEPMDYKRLTAPCGRDCFNCPIYLAKNAPALRRRVSRRLNIPEDKAMCNGCRDEGGVMGFLSMTRPCKLYACAENKNVDFCCDCEDFPCDHLHPLADKADVFPHNTKVFNLCLIKKMGLETWAETKAKDVFKAYFNGELTI